MVASLNAWLSCAWDEVLQCFGPSGLEVGFVLDFDYYFHDLSERLGLFLSLGLDLFGLFPFLADHTGEPLLEGSLDEILHPVSQDLED